MTSSYRQCSTDTTRHQQIDWVKSIWFRCEFSFDCLFFAIGFPLSLQPPRKHFVFVFFCSVQMCYSDLMCQNSCCFWLCWCFVNSRSLLNVIFLFLSGVWFVFSTLFVFHFRAENSKLILFHMLKSATYCRLPWRVHYHTNSCALVLQVWLEKATQNVANP